MRREGREDFCVTRCYLKSLCLAICLLQEFQHPLSNKSVKYASLLGIKQWGVVKRLQGPGGDVSWVCDRW